MIINAENDKNMNDLDRREIIERTLNIYFEKNKKKTTSGK